MGVGNIAYDTPESELKEIFGRVGNVASLRMVYDKDTKQPKGYGFCDYSDPDSAMAAVKELSDVECNGRKLRIDLADIALRSKDAMGAPRSLSAPMSLPLPAGSGGPPRAPGPGGGPLPPGAKPPPLSLPAGAVPPKPVAVVEEGLGAGAATAEAVLAAVSAHTEIAQTVAAMPKVQLQLCLGTMKRIAVEAPEHARAMLQDNPQMCYALLHAQLLLGLTTDPKTMPNSAECAQLRAEVIASRSRLFPPGSGVVLPPGAAGRGRLGFPVPGVVRPPVQPMSLAAPQHAWATAPPSGPVPRAPGAVGKASVSHPYAT